MKHKEFIGKIDDERIKAAIAKAESATSGQIRVLVSRRKWANPTAAAAKHFKAMGMDKVPLHNAILIFFAPQSRTFAVYGGAAVHAKCGEEFWKTLRDEMAVHLKEARWTEAIVHAVERAGELLGRHFPAEKKGE